MSNSENQLKGNNYIKTKPKYKVNSVTPTNFDEFMNDIIKMAQAEAQSINPNPANNTKNQDEVLYFSIRANLIKEAFNITPDDLKVIYEIYLEAVQKDGQINKDAKSIAHNMASIAIDRVKVAKGAEQTHKADLRSIRENKGGLVKEAISTVGVLPLILGAALAGTGAVAFIPGIVAAMSIGFSAIYKSIQNRRLRKREANDNSDTVEKVRNYEQYIKNELMPIVMKFCEIIDSKKDSILSEYKKIFGEKGVSKKQKTATYQKFLKSVVNEALESAGIGNQKVEITGQPLDECYFKNLSELESYDEEEIPEFVGEFEEEEEAKEETDEFEEEYEEDESETEEETEKEYEDEFEEQDERNKKAHPNRNQERQM